MLVYKVINKINGKVYIGQTKKKVNKRWEEHVYKAFELDGNDYIHNAIRKYGPEAFDQVVLVDCQTKYSMNMWERKHIFEHSSYDYTYGYNMTFGGDSVPLTDEGKRKISIANKGRKQTPEQIEKRIAPLRGRRMSDENKAKIKESWKTRSPVSEETKKKQSESHLRRYEENPKLKIDAGNRARGRVVSDETRDKMSKPRGKRNKPLSEETRKRMSGAHLKRYIDNPELRVIQSERMKARGGPSTEAIQKSANSRRGKKYGPHKKRASEETKQRKSEAAKKRHERERLEKIHQPKINLLCGRKPFESQHENS